MKVNKTQEMIEVYERQLKQINEAIDKSFKLNKLDEVTKLIETRDEISSSLYEMLIAKTDIDVGSVIAGFEEERCLSNEPEEFVKIEIYGNKNCKCSNKVDKILVETRIVNVRVINDTIRELNKKIALHIYEDYVIKYMSDEGDEFYEQN